MSPLDIKKIATGFRKGFLGKNPSSGQCFVLSVSLQGYLDFMGCKTDLIEGGIRDTDWNHFWLRLPDGTIIDPTADQFNGFDGLPKMPRIYIGPKPEHYEVA